MTLRTRLERLERYGGPGGTQQEVRCCFIETVDPKRPDLEPIGVESGRVTDPFILDRLPGETVEELQDRACARAGEGIHILLMRYPVGEYP